MFDFVYLKNRYVAAIQFVMACNVGCNAAKQGNEILNKVCKVHIDNSNYCEMDKNKMKHDLDCTKKILSQEIDSYYSRV